MRPQSDWHPADIIASLRKSGWSLRTLSAAHGYAPKTLGEVLRRPYPRLERIVAKALGLSPQRIWPSRYAKRKGRKS